MAATIAVALRWSCGGSEPRTRHKGNDVAATAMKEHLGWSQMEKRLVLSAFFVADMSCMFIAGLR
jgi:hypothetical protein